MATVTHMQGTSSQWTFPTDTTARPLEEDLKCEELLQLRWHQLQLHHGLFYKLWHQGLRDFAQHPCQGLDPVVSAGGRA